MSYSLDKLNDTLRKVWAQNVPAQKFSITSQDEDQFTGETIYTTWLLTFEFVAKVDLRGVQLENGKPVGQTSTREVIQFTDKTNTDAYIVFSFGTVSSTYSIQAVPGSTVPVPSNFSVGLRASLAAWMQDPRNVNSIKIALATINNKSREGLSFLTPQAAAFSLYASTTTDQPTKVGCLSVYTQTIWASCSCTSYGRSRQGQLFHEPKWL